jgi:hypothetical protein
MAFIAALLAARRNLPEGWRQKGTSRGWSAPDQRDIGTRCADIFGKTAPMSAAIFAPLMVSISGHTRALSLAPHVGDCCDLLNLAAFSVDARRQVRIRTPTFRLSDFRASRLAAATRQVCKLL